MVKRGLVSAVALFTAQWGWAAVTVTPVSPYFLNTDLVVSYAGSSDSGGAQQTAPTGGFVASGYQFFNLDAALSDDAADRNDAVFFDIQIDNTFTLASGESVVITAGVLPDSSLPPKIVPLAYANGNCTWSGVGSACVANGFSALYDTTTNIPVRVAIYPRDICKAVTSGITYNGCATTGTTGQVNNPATALTSLTIAFYVHKYSGTSSPAPTESDLKKRISLQFQTASPSLSCPAGNLADAYTPGDGQISLNPIYFVPTLSSNGSAPIAALLVKAQVGTLTTSNTASFLGDLSYVTASIPVGATPVVSGFTNTTDGADNVYGIAFNVMDASGVVPDFTPGCTYSGANGVQTSSIQGFLKKSSCFIATAAFRSTDTAPVLLLREFRDEILLQFGAGRAFVSWYYNWSPSAAEWLMGNTVFRHPVLIVLAPLEFFAWLVLHPTLLLALLAGSALAAWRGRSIHRRRRVGFLAVLLLGVSIGTTADVQAQGSNQTKQPYIDQLKQQLSEEAPQKPTASESFIEAQKRKLAPTDIPPGGYIDAIKQSDPETFRPSEKGSYIEQELPRIGVKSTGGAIEAVHKGSSQLRPVKQGEIRSAVGFRFGVAQDWNVSASSDYAYRSYNDVYGTSFVPALSFFYEFQPFHSEWFGNVGIIAGTGFSWKKTTGLFEFAPLKSGGGNFARQSGTNFQFVTIPVSLGLTYRFNLLRILRPYVMVAPTGIIFAETRNDRDSFLKGFSKGLSYGAGLALQMDWFDRKASWDLYDTASVKQYYLTLDYLRCDTTGNVGIDINGLTLGLTFEI